MPNEVKKCLPCPFCGSEDIKVHWMGYERLTKFVKCNNCGASSEQDFDTDKTIEAWNRRVSDDK